VSWQTDPGWRLVAYDPEYWRAKKKRPPEKPTAKAELAQPEIWASLYDGSRPVATWQRPLPPSEGNATVAA
jgi:hypothetical protein